MIDLGPHAAYIVWTYVVVFSAMLGLTVYTLIDARRIEVRLKALDAMGVRRRSLEEEKQLTPRS